MAWIDGAFELVHSNVLEGNTPSMARAYTLGRCRLAFMVVID